MGPIGACRVGWDGKKYLLNPKIDMENTNLLDLVVAGTNEGVLMVESEANELNEKIMLGAVDFGHKELKNVIKGIIELANSIIPLITFFNSLCPKSTAPSIIFSFNSLASDSTINTPSFVPATTRSSKLVFSMSILGFKRYFLPSQPTLHAPIGPINGKPDKVNAADEAIIATISGSF